MHDSWPPPAMRGKFFHNLRSKNAKNHAISLLQMQGCPQSNIKQEIKSFCFSIMNFLKTKKPKLKSSLLKRTIQKKSDLSLNNSKENTCFVIERNSKQETNPSKPNKEKVAKRNSSKDVKQTVSKSI
jgi:hypothetical protein